MIVEKQEKNQSLIKQNIPETINQATIYLSNVIDDNDKQYLLSLEENELICLHHSLGRFIRNEFKLWGGSNLRLLKETKKIHPDDASMVILKAFWKTLFTDKIAAQLSCIDLTTD
jgi:hypothetical protein